MMNDMLSQEEIDALLRGSSAEEDEIVEELDSMEKDAIGEIGNINMGSSATTLSTILGKRVDITTPTVDVINVTEIADEHPVPYIMVKVGYREGLNGMNMLILKEVDVKVIASLMMGGDGQTDIPDELSEIHLSAISEAMNQMVGSSSTSLSEMISKKIDILPPEVFRMDFANGGFDPEIFESQNRAVRVSFRMTIENLIDSNIMQLMPIDFAKSLVNNMLYGNAQEPAIPSVMDTSDDYAMLNADSMGLNEVGPNELDYSMQNTSPPQMSAMPNVQVREQPAQRQQQFNINPAQFESFDRGIPAQQELPENIELIKDVFLKVTVELGRTTRSIDEILSFGPGTIIELEKLVGEALDILVNGKKIAKGEVVVIDENYGIRITDILKTSKRLSSL
ncbi:flagellar motor switch protein FliN/FliY [Peptoclostridium litorale DSM 5388]|uniref:Flagellar motor switch phosphatase FliY n=1 Tax=Peptoclostridium litorale DSM 5388 TaxID=1121324 RepID=A0A069REI0_PEPLI|nr:flagellar motor switch phosphatase FliY [Peptoclostridium litorale]KDR95173.1 flagellar motor switch phosphatase FliY [Peptoclostridium litorale DSM 5388]SIN73838.1 flagellar motor switch protein FliN/FliY [Peptoclostridium litorale DSM 5388]